MEWKPITKLRMLFNDRHEPVIYKLFNAILAVIFVVISHQIMNQLNLIFCPALLLIFFLLPPAKKKKIIFKTHKNIDYNILTGAK